MRYFSILLKLITLVGFTIVLAAVLFSQGAQAKELYKEATCPESYWLEERYKFTTSAGGTVTDPILEGYFCKTEGKWGSVSWADPTCPADYEYSPKVGKCRKASAVTEAEEVEATRSSAKNVLVYETLKDSLGEVLKHQCPSTGARSDPEYKDCVNNFPTLVSDCFTTANNFVETAWRGHEVTEQTKNEQKQTMFSSCLANKTGYSKDDIRAAIGGFDFNDLSKKSTEAGDQAAEAKEEAYDKTSCDASGGTWDDATKTCTPAEAEDNPTCSIDGIGWIVCPTINFLANVTDASYGFLADNFLNTPASLFQRSTPEGKNLFTAWQAFLNLANALLVIGFLVVVFSQISGIGISNYGIKKMLPKIILAAVLINTSFYICALAVDLSNIIGYTSKDFLDGLVNSGSSTGGSAWSTGGGFAGMAGTVLAGGAAVAASGGVSLALVALMSVLASGAIALIMIFFILTIRQVVIILLVVLAPLAFVSMFLPNTEKWFRKWREVFTGMLLLFPIVGIIYGASLLSQDVISSVYSSSGSNDMLKQIVTAAMMILPLYLVPIVLKKSLNSIGDIGGKLSGIGGKMSGKVSKGMNESQFAQHQRAQRAQRQAQIRSGTYSGRGGKFNPRNWRSGVHRRLNSSRLFNTITSGYGDKMGVMGASVAAAQDKEAMEAANASISAMNLGSDGLMSIIKTGEHGGQKVSSHQRRAAIQQLAKISTGSEAAELARMTSTVFGGNSSDAVSLRKEAVAAISQVASKAPYLGGKSLAEMQAGTYDEGRAMDEYMQQKIKAEDFKSMDASIAQSLRERAAELAKGGNSASLSGLQAAKATLDNSPELKSQISAGMQGQINQI